MRVYFYFTIITDTKWSSSWDVRRFPLTARPEFFTLFYPFIVTFNGVESQHPEDVGKLRYSLTCDRSRSADNRWLLLETLNKHRPYRKRRRVCQERSLYESLSRSCYYGNCNVFKKQQQSALLGELLLREMNRRLLFIDQVDVNETFWRRSGNVNALDGDKTD